jgi:hypothetical protein
VLNRTAIAISAALLVVACSCSSGGSKAQPPAPTPTTAKRRPPVTRRSTATSAPAGPTTSPVTAPPAPALADLILSTGPPGFELQADDVADTGPTNLAKATDDDVSPDGGRALMSSGFQGGYQRQWTSVDAGTGNTLSADFAFLYQFATPEGAQAYVQHWRLTSLNTNQDAAIQSFTPPFIPGAFGLSVIDKRGSTAAVMFSKGQYAVQVLVSGGPLIDQSGAATDMAFAQYQRLP